MIAPESAEDVRPTLQDLHYIVPSGLLPRARGGSPPLVGCRAAAEQSQGRSTSGPPTRLALPGGSARLVGGGGLRTGVQSAAARRLWGWPRGRARRRTAPARRTWPPPRVDVRRPQRTRATPRASACWGATSLPRCVPAAREARALRRGARAGAPRALPPGAGRGGVLQVIMGAPKARLGPGGAAARLECVWPLRVEGRVPDLQPARVRAAAERACGPNAAPCPLTKPFAGHVSLRWPPRRREARARHAARNGGRLFYFFEVAFVPPCHRAACATLP